MRAQTFSRMAILAAFSFFAIMVGSSTAAPQDQPQSQQEQQPPQQPRTKPPFPAPPQLKIPNPFGKPSVKNNSAGEAGRSAPPVLYVEIEEVAHGKMPEHDKNILEQLATYRHAGWKLSAISLQSLVGPSNELEFLLAFDSFGAIDQLAGQFFSPAEDAAKEQALENEEDALHASKHTLLAVYRQDLSYRPDANSMAHARLVFTNEHIVKFGHDAEYVADTQFLRDNFERVNADRHWFIYQVVAGAPPGTYIRIEPMKGLADWDGQAEIGAKLAAGLDTAGKKRLAGLMKDYGLQVPAAADDLGDSPATRLYFIRPDISMVSDGFAALDPAFWRPAQK